MAPLRSSRAKAPTARRPPNRDPSFVPAGRRPLWPGALSAPWLRFSRSKVVFSFVLESGWGELSKGEQLQTQVFAEEVRGLDPHPPTPSPTFQRD